MTDYNLTKLIIHPEWSQVWQNISSDLIRENLNQKSLAQRLPRGLVPSSLIARDTDGNQIRFALIPEKSIDQLSDQIKVILTDQDNAKIEGTVLSIRNNQVTLHSNGKYVRVFKPKSIISVKHTELHPLVSLLGIQSSDHDLHLQYILNSLRWKIHYTITLLGKKEIIISLRASIINNSHSSFFSKNIILIAGKAAHPPRDSYRLETNQLISHAVKESNQPENNFSEDLIQIAKFDGILRPGEMYMNTDKAYRTGYLKLYRHYFGQNQTEIIYRFDSPDRMPYGKVLVYDGNQENFIGSSVMPESNQGQLTDLLIGESSLQVISTIDLGKTVVIDISGKKFSGEEISLTTQFTNPRQEPVPILLIYHAPRQILKSNPIYRRREGHTYEWLVNYQPSPDKQMITINIIQLVDKFQNKGKEKMQLFSPRNPPNSEESVSQPSPLDEIESRRLSMVTEPEPKQIITDSQVTSIIGDVRLESPSQNNFSRMVALPPVRGGSMESDLSPRTQPKLVHIPLGGEQFHRRVLPSNGPPLHDPSSLEGQRLPVRRRF